MTGTTTAPGRSSKYAGLTRPELAEILISPGPASIRDREGFRAAWRVAGPPRPQPQDQTTWQPVPSSRVSAYVPPGRLPFLPFGARSGWELLAVLEMFGCRIHGSDVLDEGILISQCLQFMK
jgi:hypothetical protein